MNNISAESEFYTLYERNVETVYQIAFMHFKNKSDAEDAVQNIFLKVYDTKPVFENERHEKAWFIVAARNHCRDVMRTWWFRRRADDETELMYSQYETEEEGEITRVLMNLPAKYRELLYLYYYKEYSVKEIADMLDMNESTLRTQLSRARDKMKKYLEKEDEDFGQKRYFESV